MLELRNLSLGFLGHDLFKDVSLHLYAGERYGLTGANGSGKSSLLKIIAGEIEQDNGEVIIEPKKSLFRIGQDHNLDDAQLIIDTAMLGKKEVYLALKRQEELILAKNPQISHEKIAQDEELISDLNGYQLKSKAESILSGLGIAKELFEKPLGVLSGGYKWRCFLAQVLLNEPDILLLDEPTNHLDIVSIRWLEQFLARYMGLLIMVSHDRRFMDHVVTRILDIDFCAVKEYKGNYTNFTQKRLEFLLTKEKELLRQKREIEHKQAFVDKFRAKASKARQAQSRLKQIERIVIEEPIVSSRVHPKISFEPLEQGSKEVLTVKHLNKSFNDNIIFKDFSFSIKRADKVCVIGQNGTGKSTLIKALAKEFAECDSQIRWGLGVLLGYFPQDVSKIILKDKHTVLSWIWQFAPELSQGKIQSHLSRVLFSGDDVKKSTANLSGGELSRLYLARLMLLRPNVLLLDEPTNHLDLESIESLKQALKEFKGTIILVSHDRDFVEQIATRIIEIEHSGPEEFLGTYHEFVLSKDKDYLDVKEESIIPKKVKSAENLESKISYEEQKRKKNNLQKLNKDLEKIMHECAEIERKIALIENQFLDGDFYINNDLKKVHELQKENEDLKRLLEENIKKWESIELALKSFSGL